VDSRAQEVVVKALDDCKALQQAGATFLHTIVPNLLLIQYLSYYCLQQAGGKILECNQKRQRHNMAVRALQLLLWVVLCGVLLAIGYWVPPLLVYEALSYECMGP
jgi:predicted nucleic acid-binding Zn ribbon protein